MSDNNKIINEMKTSLIKYYDTIKSKLNARSQLIQANIKKDIQNLNDPKVVEYQNLILKLDDSYLKTIDQIFDRNMKQINENQTQISEFNLTDLKNCCYYIDNQPMNVFNKYKSNYPLGVLIVTDWFLSKNEINFLSSHFEYDRSNESEQEISARLKAKKDENEEEYEYKLKFDMKLLNLYDLFTNLDRMDEKKTELNEVENIIYLNKQEIIDRLSKVKEFHLFTDDTSKRYLIENICKDAFINMININELGISVHYDKYVTINKDTFKGLINLKKLELDLNNIYNQFDSSVIDLSHMPNLEELCFQNLKTNNLKSNLLSGLSKLKHLKITESYVKHIDFDFFHTVNSKLESLNLRELVIVYGYSNLFTGMSNLKSLDFTQTRIDICRENDDIEYIDLEKHVLNHLPALTKLELDWDDFENIYNKCQLFSNIEELGLFFDNFNWEFDYYNINPKYFVPLKNLKKIKLEFNEMKGVELELKKSFFNVFKKKFHQIESLEITRLFETKIHHDAFSCFKNLKTLKLPSCYLKNIKRSYFNGLDNLEKLDLSDNMITRIDSNTFNDLTKLKWLSFELNELTGCDSYIQPKLFKPCAKTLEMLDLSGTDFKVADLENFKTKFGFNSNIDIHCYKTKIEDENNKLLIENIKKMQDLYDKSESKYLDESFIYYTNSNNDSSDQESDQKSNQLYDKDEFFSNLYDNKPHDSDNQDDDSNNDYESYGDSDDSDQYINYARAILNNSNADKMWYQYTHLYN